MTEHMSHCAKSLPSHASRCVVISGCSGGGKSTLLAMLARQGHRVVPEPGRRVVHEEQDGAGRAVPWVDLEAFLRRTLNLAAADYAAHRTASDWVFFDRSMVDAADGLRHFTGVPAADAETLQCYHATVFLAPPWPEIYVNDAERKHGFVAAEAEYWRLRAAYAALGYQLRELPRLDVAARAAWLLEHLRPGQPYQDGRAS